MQFNQRLEDALYGWALGEQQSMSIGYPKTAAGFSEYQAGYRTSAPVPSMFEIDVQGLVERGVAQLRLHQDKRPYTCLVEFYGAYPDAPGKNERLKRLFRVMKKRTAYAQLEKGKLYLQGIIDVYAADIS